MFKKNNYLTNDEKIKKRAELLYGNTKENKSISNNDDEVKGELSALVEMDTKKKPNTIKKEKDYSKTADLLYPNMKNKTDKIDTIKSDKNNNNNEKLNNDNKNNFTGGAASTKNTLKNIGLDNNYEIKNGAISPLKKQKEYEIINNIKYPNNTGNKKVEEMLNQAKQERSEKYRKDTEDYLKFHELHKQFGIDHSDNKIIKARGKKIYGNEAIENLEMSKTKSYINTDYAKKHKIYNNYNEAPDNLKNYFKDKITEQIGADKLGKTKGIYIDADSESSNSLKSNLLKDNDFIEKLKKYDNAMNKKYKINDSINLKGKNWGNAVGNADIRDMHINKNGDIEFYVTDVYDFNEGEKNPLVKIGRNRQDNGNITPYFYAYRVIISKEEKEQLLKRGKNND